LKLNVVIDVFRVPRSHLDCQLAKKFDPQSRTYSVSTVGERMKATTVIGYLVSNYMVVSIDGDQNKRAIPVVLSADPVYFDGILAQPSCFSPLTPEIKHALSLP
jgi:predicted membrane protein